MDAESFGSIFQSLAAKGGAGGGVGKECHFGVGACRFIKNIFNGCQKSGPRFISTQTSLPQRFNRTNRLSIVRDCCFAQGRSFLRVLLLCGLQPKTASESPL